jgi:hypothetical protein
MDATTFWTIFLVILFMLLALAFVFRQQLKRFGKGIAEIYGWLKIPLTWGFPPILIFVAWLFKGLHDTSFFSALATGGGVLVLILGIVWILGIELPMNNEPDTPLHVLKQSFYASVTWAGIALAATVYVAATRSLQPWLAFPTILVWVELYAATKAGFNNAFQKNPTQIQKTA